MDRKILPDLEELAACIKTGQIYKNLPDLQNWQD